MRTLSVGAFDGEGVGTAVGAAVGSTDSEAVCATVGANDGEGVGASVDVLTTVKQLACDLSVSGCLCGSKSTVRKVVLISKLGVENLRWDAFCPREAINAALFRSSPVSLSMAPDERCSSSGKPLADDPLAARMQTRQATPCCVTRKVSRNHFSLINTSSSLRCDSSASDGAHSTGPEGPKGCARFSLGWRRLLAVASVVPFRFLREGGRS